MHGLPPLMHGLTPVAWLRPSSGPVPRLAVAATVAVCAILGGAPAASAQARYRAAQTGDIVELQDTRGPCWTTSSRISTVTRTDWRR